MMKKLASRKLWVAIIGFVSAILVIFGVDDIQIEHICTLLGALGTLCAYIFAEGYIDAKSIKTDTSSDEIEENTTEESQNEEKL